MNLDKYTQVPSIYELLRHNKVIFLNGDINEDLATEIIAQLLYYDSIAKANEEIKMYINSYGGTITAGLSIIDIMKACQHSIHTICTGICASMAGIILASGNERSILPHSFVMVHEASGMSHEKLTDAKVSIKVLTALQKTLVDILRKRTLLFSSKKGKKIDLSHDMWLTAKQAVELKIVDTIIK